MKFRDYMGGFAESMATTIEVKSKEDITAHISKQYEWAGEVVKIQVMRCGRDRRNGWDTHVVQVRFSFDDKTMYVVGYTDGKL